jgi:hypothetical protein
MSMHRAYLMLAVGLQVHGRLGIFKCTQKGCTYSKEESVRLEQLASHVQVYYEVRITCTHVTLSAVVRISR